MLTLTLRHSGLARRYGIGAATVLLAITAVRLLQPVFGGNIPLLLLLPFVVGAAWFGGFISGLLSTGLQSLAAAYFLVPPVHSLSVGGSRGWITLAVFVSQGILISLLCESRWRLNRSYIQTTNDLRLALAVASTRSDSLRYVSSDLKYLTAAVRDLSAPLRLLQSLAYRLATNLEELNVPHTQDCVESIQSNTSRIANFVDSLIPYSSVQEEKRLFADIDSQVLVERAAAQFADEVQRLGGGVTYDQQLPIVRGDAEQLLQLFSELIGNAIKFRNDDPLRVHVSCKRLTNTYVFSVSDNGVGIIPAHWEEAFVLFRRFGGKQCPGAGVGLAICRRIVEIHGGRIWLSSAAGVGTTVRFEIPKLA